MSGLLNQDQWTALGLLGNGISNRNFSGGAVNAMQYLDQAPEKKLRLGLLQSQMDNYSSEIEQRKAAIEKAKKDEEFFQSIFGPKPAQMGQLGSGSFGIMPTAPGVPSIPQSGGQGGGAIVPNLSFDQLAALKRRGLDLTDIHKYANDPRKLESGSTYENRVTGQREYMPKLPEGMAPGTGGQYGFVPGYQQSVIGLEGGKAAATAAAQAGQDLVKVVGPDGAEHYVTRAQAVQASQPRQMAPQRPPMQPQGQPTGAYVGDPQVVRAAINDIKDPTERTRALQAYEQQYGPLQATPTTAQTTHAAADKEMAVQTARDVAEQRKGIVNAGFAAPTNIAKYQQIGKLLADVDGGTLTPMGTHLASTMNSLGFKVDKNLPNKEAAAALANEAALQLRSPAGGAGMPGAMSDQDRNFLASMTPSMTQSAQGRKQVIDAYVAVQQRNQQVAQFARNYEKKYGKLDNGFFDQLQAWSGSNPLFRGK